LLPFNFGTLREWSKPGAWRRGYGYLKTRQVKTIALTQVGVTATVKGNFKEAYDVALAFMPDAVLPSCSCPLEDPWCKHSIAVGLESIEQHLWEAYWGLLPNIPPPPPEDPEAYLGQFIVYLNPSFRTKSLKKLQRFQSSRGDNKTETHGAKGRLKQAVLADKTPEITDFGLCFMERRTGKVVTHIEPVLRAAMALQNQSVQHGGPDMFNEAEKLEMAILQLPLKQGQSRSKEGWYPVSVTEADTLLPLLSQLEDCRNPEGVPWVFEPDPLHLSMGVNVSTMGNVLVSLHWIQPASYYQPADAFPLDDLVLPSRVGQWGFRHHTVYKLQNPLKDVPHALSKTAFTDIKDADGGRFMYEEMPKLRKIAGQAKGFVLDEADVVETLKVARTPPKALLSVASPNRLDDPERLADVLNDPSQLRLRISLDFIYDGERVPYTRSAPDSPYVLSNNDSTGQVCWIRRDYKLERTLYRMLTEGEVPQHLANQYQLPEGLTLDPMQGNFLQAEGDKVIDILSFLLPALTPSLRSTASYTEEDLDDLDGTSQQDTAQPSDTHVATMVDNTPSALSSDSDMQRKGKRRKRKRPKLTVPQHATWTIAFDEDMSAIRVAKSPLKIRASIDFDVAVDQFVLKIDCVVGKRPLDLDTAQSHLMQGHKYFYLPPVELSPLEDETLAEPLPDAPPLAEQPSDEASTLTDADEAPTVQAPPKPRVDLTQEYGYVEIPLASILQFGKTLQCFDAEVIGPDTYRVHTFKAGLIAELVDQGVELNLSPRFEVFWNLVTAFSTLKDMAVPANVDAELREYQKQGYNWLWFLYTYGLNGILADDMGLGKTLQTLTLLQKVKNESNGAVIAPPKKRGRPKKTEVLAQQEDALIATMTSTLASQEPRPSLIIAPTSVVYNWIKEATRFTPDLSVIDLTGPNRHLMFKKIPETDLALTSYALLRRDISALKHYNFRYVILDESQNIKNVTSQTALASKALQAHHRLALSGTPIENRLSELWSVFDFLMPTFLDDMDGFRYRYITQIEEKGNRDAERRLKKQVAPFILRRLKKDVAKDLPPKVENVVYCELTSAQQKLYLKLLEQTKADVFSVTAEGKAKSSTQILGALLRLRQVCCDPRLLSADLSDGVTESGKLEALTDMLEELISEGHRVLLFSQFVEMLKLIRPWLDKKGIPYEYLTGETPPDKRAEAVERFNNTTTSPVFLISLKAGGTGLNLTGADYVIHYDPWWNPAAEDQATDRAHRIGQTKSVFVYRFIARGTVEEKILKLQARKRELVDAILTTNKGAAGKLFTLDDLRDILTPDF
jgi:superfamily II DNA or RNA helicase